MKFHSNPIPEHVEVPLADEGRLDDRVARWSRHDEPAASDSAQGKACYVLCIRRSGEAGDPASQLAEICGLVKAQGDRVVGHEVYELKRPQPRTLVRSGVAQRVSERARQLGADMLVVDAELSPSQTRNLEDETHLPLLDREGVILNVFQRNARTKRARAQVEMAHLQYLRPRIRGMGLDMDQQAGGVLYARGAGETASELMARRIDDRIAELRKRLASLQQADATLRKRRDGCARIVLLGYTNAGKTSLMNALAATELAVRDRPFETLDTTARCLSRHGGDVLLSDTVGFIRRLPQRLFESFASTLAEVSEASLLLIVVDASDPDRDSQFETTERVLEKLGAADRPRLLVWNKLDQVRARGEAFVAPTGATPSVALSTHDAVAVAGLRQHLLELATVDHASRELFIPYALREAGNVTALIHRHCRVLHTHASERGTQLRIEGPSHHVAAIVSRLRRLKS